MYIIDVEIKNKKAVRTNETAYTCDNGDFIVVFSFDEEWDAFPTKTARFVYNDKHQDVVFTGNECPMPIISNTKLISVGVFAGDLHTTTPAVIVANKSILGASGVPDAPPENVYNQIVGLCDEALTTAHRVEEQVNNGDFDGEDGYTPIKGTDYWTEEDKAEIQTYIDEQTAVISQDIEGLQKQISEEAHFRGYVSTNAKIQAMEATPNDFAYSAESGTKWVYDEVDGWKDTGSPVPDQLTPASNATPLMDGAASVGEASEYARGDHRHPTDTTRVSNTDFNEYKNSMKTELGTLATKKEFADKFTWKLLGEATVTEANVTDAGEEGVTSIAIDCGDLSGYDELRINLQCGVNKANADLTNTNYRLFSIGILQDMNETIGDDDNRLIFDQGSGNAALNHTYINNVIINSYFSEGILQYSEILNNNYNSHNYRTVSAVSLPSLTYKIIGTAAHAKVGHPIDLKSGKRIVLFESVKFKFPAGTELKVYGR